jgi:hypothetical protein
MYVKIQDTKGYSFINIINCPIIEVDYNNLTVTFSDGEEFSKTIYISNTEIMDVVLESIEERTFEINLLNQMGLVNIKDEGDNDEKERI